MGHGQGRLGRGQGRAVYRKTWLINQHYHVLVSTPAGSDMLDARIRRATSDRAGALAPAGARPAFFETLAANSNGVRNRCVPCAMCSTFRVTVFVKQLHGSQGTNYTSLISSHLTARAE